MKLICEYPPGTLRNNITTVNNIPTVGKTVRNVPGIGQPFLIFASLPSPPIMADFSMFPDYVVSANEADNVAMIEAMLADPPLAALTF